MEKAEAELYTQNNESHRFIVQAPNAYFCKSYPCCVFYTGASYQPEKGNVSQKGADVTTFNEECVGCCLILSQSSVWQYFQRIVIIICEFDHI